MKCRECHYARKGYFKSVPEAYVCIKPQKPLVIPSYVDAECFILEDKNSIEDGVYMELFAVKDGMRYNAKIVNMKEVSTILTNGLMDSIQKLWQ